MATKSEMTQQETIEVAQSNFGGDHVAIHTDTYDIDIDALGINLPKRYYLSPGFVGTVIVCSQLHPKKALTHLIRLYVLAISAIIWDGLCHPIRWH